MNVELVNRFTNKRPLQYWLCCFFVIYSTLWSILWIFELSTSYTWRNSYLLNIIRVHVISIFKLLCFLLNTCEPNYLIEGFMMNNDLRTYFHLETKSSPYLLTLMVCDLVCKLVNCTWIFLFFLFCWIERF